jgi:hypothetical protein
MSRRDSKIGFAQQLFWIHKMNEVERERFLKHIEVYSEMRWWDGYFTGCFTGTVVTGFVVLVACGLKQAL